MDGNCGKCHGMMLVILGAIIWLNAVWWYFDWWKLFGTLLLLVGIVHVIRSPCSCRKNEECCKDGVCEKPETKAKPVAPVVSAEKPVLKAKKK